MKFEFHAELEKTDADVCIEYKINDEENFEYSNEIEEIKISNFQLWDEDGENVISTTPTEAQIEELKEVAKDYFYYYY